MINVLIGLPVFHFYPKYYEVTDTLVIDLTGRNMPTDKFGSSLFLWLRIMSSLLKEKIDLIVIIT